MNSFVSDFRSGAGKSTARTVQMYSAEKIALPTLKVAERVKQDSIYLRTLNTQRVIQLQDNHYYSHNFITI